LRDDVQSNDDPSDAISGIVIKLLSEEDVMKLSARNQLKGKVIEVRKGQTTAHVRIDVGGGLIITSSITNEAVDDLALKAGDAVWAVIKASDVMVGK
jgi:molybdopterin-binding protein